jgi:hypothetical protein
LIHTVRQPVAVRVGFGNEATANPLRRLFGISGTAIEAVRHSVIIAVKAIIGACAVITFVGNCVAVSIALA